MNGEILAILEQIEREKGIKKDILIQAVESALSTAVRKTMGLNKETEVKVEIDRKTGEIRATEDGKEITTVDFGRIAATTARQVIIQKIREAEKEVIFSEFSNKVGEIVSGTVYRFDKKNIIVDLLGKAEGILLRSQQAPHEEFKQGERIRAYVLEVKKESRGTQIILSRTHPNFVKKLFEMEVPEIYEGIVEIKAIARLPSQRTKIAVWSKDDRVDSVGACVGVRGNRVKNIVAELRGERIDIVRWNEDISQFIQAAITPARVSEIKLDKQNRKALVIVDEDQLSLAIGKHGQNVRLASLLVDWELDVRTPAALKKKELLQVEEKKQDSLNRLSIIGEKLRERLSGMGFKTLKDIASADIDKLTRIKGVGKVKAKRMIEEAQKIIKEDVEEKNT
ncbi:MAG: transcription termination factor NusA [Candidatus Omnitrophica bacterium]|nr:transcription termination factor NusA [Candidatus Omnitrophota bacterium]